MTIKAKRKTPKTKTVELPDKVGCQAECYLGPEAMGPPEGWLPPKQGKTPKTKTMGPPEGWLPPKQGKYEIQEDYSIILSGDKGLPPEVIVTRCGNIIRIVSVYGGDGLELGDDEAFLLGSILLKMAKPTVK